MRNLLKAAIVAFGVTGALAAAPASAQPYDDPGYVYDHDYYDPDGGYPDDAYAYGDAGL